MSFVVVPCRDFDGAIALGSRLITGGCAFFQASSFIAATSGLASRFPN